MQEAGLVPHLPQSPQLPLSLIYGDFFALPRNLCVILSFIYSLLIVLQQDHDHQVDVSVTMFIVVEWNQFGAGVPVQHDGNNNNSNNVDKLRKYIYIILIVEVFL